MLTVSPARSKESVMVRVVPPSVRQYASTAQQQFDTIRIELQGLIDDAVRVQYFGANAVAFKTDCGQLASDLSRSLGADLARMAGSVQHSVSAILASLGEPPVTLSVNAAAIVPPAVPAGDGSVEVDLTGLENLKPEVERRMSRITSTLDDHVAALHRTDWTGNAKDRLMGEVRTGTTKAKEHVSHAQRVITARIDRQRTDTEHVDS
jgi:hypothetical protein